MRNSLLPGFALMAAFVLSGCVLFQDIDTLVASHIKSPVHKAAFRGDVATVTRFLDSGGSADGADEDGVTLLQYATSGMSPQMGMVRLLLDRGADVDSRNSKWAPPLYSAAIHEHVEIARLLIERGADVGTVRDRLESQNNDNRWKGPRTLDLAIRQRSGTGVQGAAGGSKGPALQTVEEAQAQQDHIREIEKAGLVELLNMRPEKGVQVEALTQALIRAKNTQLATFMARSSVDERISLLTTVELRISDAQNLMARLNAMAEDAVRQGQSAAPLREEAGKVQTYVGILTAIRNLLLQS